MKRIKTWHERCEEHPDHQERIITERMIQERMQEEIDELRQALSEQPSHQEVDWEKLYRLEVKKKEALAAKYERDTGKKLTRIVPMAEPALRQALEIEQEPVAWMHNVIEGNVITHIPADIGRHPERWTALYKDPTPCKTCDSLAMAVMNDQTYHEKVIPKREWVELTDQEIHEIDGYEEDRKMYKFARAIEAKLKEKNT